MNPVSWMIHHSLRKVINGLFITEESLVAFSKFSQRLMFCTSGASQQTRWRDTVHGRQRLCLLTFFFHREGRADMPSRFDHLLPPGLASRCYDSHERRQRQELDRERATEDIYQTQFTPKMRLTDLNIGRELSVYPRSCGFN